MRKKAISKARGDHFCLIPLLFVQGNARRLFDRRCDGNTPLGKLSKLGLAPALWCIIIALLVTYIHSVVTGTFVVYVEASPFF